MKRSINNFIASHPIPVAGVFITTCILTLPFLLSFIFVHPNAKASPTIVVNTNTTYSSNADSPNVITQGISKFSNSLDNTIAKTDSSLAKGLTKATHTISSAASATTRLTLRGIGGCLNIVAKASGSFFELGIKSTVGAVSIIGDTKIISSIIRPSENGKTPLPTIDDKLPDLVKKEEALPAVAPTPPPTPAVDDEPTWPIHGNITTAFGVPHWPFQPTHTGIDISDGQPSGVSPIHPYRPGTVIEVITSKVSLGNHVVIDHGGGITSVYGHMSSLAVSVGQKVDKTTILGYEGSTGASTGTHLHLEIRVNGQPVDPHLYISGQP